MGGEADEPRGPLPNPPPQRGPHRASAMGSPSVEVRVGTAQAEDEGLAPTKEWVKDLVDEIIAEEFASPDLELVWLGPNSPFR